MNKFDKGWHELRQEPMTPVDIAIAIVCVMVIGAYFADLIARVI